jgi:hypothetical protein
MTFFVDLKIGSRLAMSFVMSAGLACCVGAMAIGVVCAAYQKMDERFAPGVATVQVLSDARSMANTVRHTTLQDLLESDRPGRGVQRKEHDEALQRYESLFARYKLMAKTFGDARQIPIIEAEWARFLETDRQLQAAVAKGETQAPEIRTLANRESASQFAGLAKAADAADAAVRTLRERGNAVGTPALPAYYSVVVGMLILVAAVVASGVGIALLITRVIVRPLTLAVAFGQTVVRGAIASDMQMDDVMQQSAGLAGKTASAVPSMSSWTSGLKDTTGVSGRSASRASVLVEGRQAGVRGLPGASYRRGGLRGRRRSWQSRAASAGGGAGSCLPVEPPNVSNAAVVAADDRSAKYADDEG